MITKTYAPPPPVEVKGPLDVVHLMTRNGAHLHAKQVTCSFDVSMADEYGNKNPDGWYFDDEACDEAIEFFTLLRDNLNSRKDT